MKKIKHQVLNKVTPKAREQQRIVQRNRDKSAEKTIQQLKQSIGSIQKMIQKSQQILRKTRPLNPRQVRSDSLQLRLNFNTQTKPKQNPTTPILTHKQPKQHLLHLSTTAITRTNTLNQSESQQNSIRNMITNQNHHQNQSQNNKIKYNRPHLFIDTDHFNSQQGSDDKHSQRDNIFIYDSRSPVSTIVQKGVEDSFADSIESAMHFGRRLRTEGVNDSVDRSLLDASIEKGSVQRKSELPTRNREQLPAKKIVLKRNKNLNLNHMKTLPQLQQMSKRQKPRIFATQAQKNPQKIKPGKYSYPNQNHQLYSIMRSPTTAHKKTEQTNKIFNYLYQSENTKKQNEQVTSSDHHSPSRRSSTKYECQKFNKQNKYMEVQQFYGRVKKFGFVERYLSYNQIGCIYQYLKNSSIPYHKWPLYVVDKVYQKMQGLSRLKTTS